MPPLPRYPNLRDLSMSRPPSSGPAGVWCCVGVRDRLEVCHAREAHSVEQIVAKLREAEKLQAQGLTIPQASKRLGISDQTF